MSSNGNRIAGALLLLSVICSVATTVSVAADVVGVVPELSPADDRRSSSSVGDSNSNTINADYLHSVRDNDHSDAVVENHSFNCEVCVALCAELDSCVRSTAVDHHTEALVRCAIENVSTMYRWEKKILKLKRVEPFLHETDHLRPDSHIPHFMKDDKGRARYDVDVDDEALKETIPEDARMAMSAEELSAELKRLKRMKKHTTGAGGESRELSERHEEHRKQRRRHSETSERVEAALELHLDGYMHDVVLQGLVSSGKARRRPGVPPTVCIEELCTEHMHVCTIGGEHLGGLYREIHEKRHLEAQRRMEQRAAAREKSSGGGGDGEEQQQRQEEQPDEEESEDKEALAQQQENKKHRPSHIEERGPPHYKFRENLEHFIRHYENHHGAEPRSTQRTVNPRSRAARHRHHEERGQEFFEHLSPHSFRHRELHGTTRDGVDLASRINPGDEPKKVIVEDPTNEDL